MKIGVLRISDEVLCGETKDKNAEIISAGFFKQNINISSYCVTSIKQSEENLLFLESISDSLLVVCDSADFELFKKKVCELLKVKLQENDFAKTGINAYFKKLNLPISAKAIKNAFLPFSSRCILNNTSENVGFIFKLNGKDVFVIPSDIEEVKQMFFGSVLPLVAKMFNKNFYSVCLKTFAIAENDIKELLSSIENSSKLNVSVFTKGLVCEILIRYKSSLDKNLVDGVASSIYEKLGKHIFTDEDKTLGDIVCDILKVQNKSLTIFEDATFGALTKEIVKSNCFEQEMLEKSEIISSKQIKSALCDQSLDEEDYIKTIMQNNMTSNNVCLANLKSSSEKNSYLIGICLGEEMEVYKIKLTGDDDEVIAKLNQTSLFYLIKKLKQKHF